MSDAVRYHRLDAGNARLIEEADVFDNDVDKTQLAAFVADPGHEMLIAVAGGRVVGFASGTILLHPDKAPAFFVNEVGVNETSQNQGIGTALVTGLLEIARSRGCVGTWLATEDDNDAARAVYRKAQARETSGIVVYDWDGAMDDP